MQLLVISLKALRNPPPRMSLLQRAEVTAPTPACLSRHTVWVSSSVLAQTMSNAALGEFLDRSAQLNTGALGECFLGGLDHDTDNRLGT